MAAQHARISLRARAIKSINWIYFYLVQARALFPEAGVIRVEAVANTSEQTKRADNRNDDDVEDCEIILDARATRRRPDEQTAAAAAAGRANTRQPLAEIRANLKLHLRPRLALANTGNQAA